MSYPRQRKGPEMTEKPDDSLVRSMMKERGVSGWIISRDFLLAIIVTVAMSYLLLASANQAFIDNAQDILIAYASASAALLGLVIAAYSIFASFGQASYLYILKKSRIYDDTVMQFAWCGVILIIAVVLSLLNMGVISVSGSSSEIIALARTTFAFATFFVFYGLFLVGVLLTTSLRMVNVLRGEYIDATKGEK